MTQKKICTAVTGEGPVGARVHQVIGRTQSQQLLAEGLHPVSPQRTVVLRRTDHGFVDADLFPLCQQINERLIDRRADPLSPEKLRLLVKATDTIARHYHVPNGPNGWSGQLALRESLMSTGVNGMGLLHQFQAPGPERVETDCEFVDWWLFLIPEGTDFESLDEKPVYTLVGHVFSQHIERLGAQNSTWALTERVAGAAEEHWFRQLAQKQPKEAARAYNKALSWAMRNTQW